ncbi:MAG: hypothetical protein HQ541_15445 [Mariniphaga sp.]|nr:hypothetical protein [Mariniphaga sp.]
MKRIFGILTLALSVVLISCEKEPNISIDQDLSEKAAEIVQDEIAVSNAESEVSYEANFYINAERAIVGMAKIGKRWNWKNILRYRIGQCPDVTINSTETGYPKTITLDYGDGVELNNGRILSGLITIVISAPHKTDGATKTVTYNNFSVDSISVSGTSEFLFVGNNETSRMHIHTGDLYFTMPDGKIIYREVNKTHEWLFGVDTPEDMTDDVIQITGSVEVSVSTGNEYFKEITTPIIKKGDCRWFVEGVVEISVNGETKIVIDYGNGDCDASATVTKDGATNEIDLSGKNPRVRNGNNGNG